MDKKAKDILFKTYWSSKGWKDERVTDPDNYIYAKEKGCSMQGTQDPAVEYLYVMEAPTGAVRR